MNSKLALTAIVAVAAIMTLGVISPAMAIPNDNASDQGKKAANAGKVTICHWQEEVIDDTDPENPVVVEEAQWVVINVSGNAQDAHVGVHTDGTDVDTIIDDSEEPAEDTITTEECLARNTA